MSNLTTFNFNNNRIDVLVINNEPWFIAKQVCDVLEIANNRDAMSRLKAYEKGVANTDTLGGNQDVTVISESGLYRLILTSRKPQAEPFQDWVVQEVLPSIRKTGSYSIQSELQLPQDYLSALKALVVSEEQKLVLQTKNQVLEAQTEFYATKLNQAEDVLQVYRAITSDDSCLTLKQVADSLNIKGLGRNNLAKYLREKRFLTQSAPVPYHRVIEAGWAIVVTTSWEDNNGNMRNTQATRLSFTGLSWLVKSLIKDGYNVRVTAEQIWDTYNASDTDIVVAKPVEVLANAL